MGTKPKFLADLNAEQRQAAEHRSGPLLVIAGAGTGKTRTLSARVANLIQHGAESRSILLLTFTRRAAAEMIRRATHLTGGKTTTRVWGGTFHAVAHRLLRIYGKRLGLGANFVVMDQGDAEDLIQLIRTDFDLHKAKARFPQKGTLLSIYSRCVNTGEDLEDVLTETFPWCEEHRADIKKVFQEYGRRKTEKDLLDYDDLLLFWEQALDMPKVGAGIAKRFSHVLVDEYQDTNPLQASILEKLWGSMTDDKDDGDRSLMVVGDDAQSIYSFRGATVANILRFPKQFKGTATVTLEQNYRSVMPILKAANAVMRPAKDKFTKNLWCERTKGRKPILVTCGDEMAQATFVAKRVLQFREEGVPLRKQAVLFRAGHNSDALEVELSRRNIPFVKWGGLKFLEAAHVKDLVAFLRIVENPLDDLSWMRVLQLLDGIGPGRARQAINHLQEHGGKLRSLTSWKAPAVAREPIGDLVDLLQGLTKSDDLPLPTQIERVRTFYAPILEGKYENPEMRSRDLDQLEVLAREARSRGAFLADLALDPPSSTADLADDSSADEECLTLSTIHSAKGCEWNVVFVIHAIDGIIPSDRVQDEAGLEEERRLLYVAMTRARDRLLVTFPLRCYSRRAPVGDAYGMAQLTRFLPPKVFPRFQRKSFGLRDDEDDPEVHANVSGSVRERVRRMWE